ncbi:TRAP transporter small permease [Bacillus sp. JCM 19034]|uniref:TRAP transporter small permease n=1 Tax=Bacillus sp. JCM 19034 TaxID=1481928 RepID=UPI0007819CA2|nr:TRAP transporter small permease [Bacillus sp. JCM 19034]
MEFLKKLDQGLVKAEEWILSYSIILIVIMIVGNTISREVFGSSWSFYMEVSRFAVTVATFMGISYAARKGRHISMTAFYDLAPFPIRKTLAILIPFVTAIVLFTLAFFGYQYFMTMVDSGQVTTALRVPVYFFAVIVPIGLFFGGIQYLRNMWVNIREKDVYLAEDRKDYS